MLGAVLRDFYASVGVVDDFLMDAFYFVSEDDGESWTWNIIVNVKALQHGAFFCLFDAVYLVAVGMQMVYSFGGCLEVLPRHGLFGSQCGLVYLCVGRLGGDAAQIDCLNAEGVAGAEHGADVIH